MKLHLFFNLLPGFLQQIIRNNYYESKIRKASIEEEKEILLLSKIIEEGSTVVDIGANFGLYTKFLSKFCGKTGSVYSIEPIPAIYKSLLNSVQKLKLKNVTPINCALSNTDGMAQMTIPEYQEGGQNYYEASLNSSEKGTNVEVQLKMLDDLLSDITQLDFIKCDVEGHELNVLKGSQKILQKYGPILMLEINGGIHDANKNALSIVDFLKGFNYCAYTYNGKDLNKLTSNDDGYNYFFLTQAHEESLNDFIQPRPVSQ